MASRPYNKTGNVEANVTSALATQYNSALSELRALMNGFEVDEDSSLAIAYNGFLVNTITIADAQGDTNDITCVRTVTYTGFLPTQYVDVYDAGEMNITVTSTLGYTGFLLTSVSRAIT